MKRRNPGPGQGPRSGKAQPAGLTPEQRRAMAHLRLCLTPFEFARVCALTANGRRLPFGTHDETAMERLLLEAGDEDLELLIKCQDSLESLLASAAQSAGTRPVHGLASDVAGRIADPSEPGDGPLPDLDWEPQRPSPRDRLHFHFDMESRILGPFLASLRRNGFRTVTVESAEEVDVFVALGGSTDLEVVREMELVQSLLEIVHMTATRSVKGRRLTP